MISFRGQAPVVPVQPATLRQKTVSGLQAAGRQLKADTVEVTRLYFEPLTPKFWRELGQAAKEGAQSAIQCYTNPFKALLNIAKKLVRK
jgi:hypothetical protein